MNMQETLNQWGDAAQEGDAEAQYILRMNCVMAPGASPDYAAAYEWFLKAATRGHAKAQNFLGWMFSHALGVPQDDEEAVKWFRLSAAQNNDAGQNNLAWMLQNGRGCQQDDEEAVVWYRKAADQNNQRGQLYYGLMCRDGRGIQKDVTEAVDWLRKSSDNGDADAAYELGKMYENGEGVEADRRSAILQYMRAAGKNHEAARAKVQELKAADPDATQGIILPSGETIEGTSVTFPRLLAERIRASTSDDERLQLVDELTRFYAESATARTAEQNWLELISSIEDLEKRAEALLRTGGRLEKCKAWTQAIPVYREAVRIEPEDRKMWYFAHNNLGFCLNQLGQFEEGEAFCRQALKIDATRSNAYKNTALALQGQSRFPEAAELFITGTLTRPQDSRSLDHLIELLEAHPEIRENRPTIDADIQKCRAAVEQANRTERESSRKKRRQRPTPVRPPFEFTLENLKKLLPHEKITVVDDDNMVVKTTLGGKLPPFRIRVTRSPKYAPGSAQIQVEFERELGRPEGWFVGLPKETQDELCARYSLRGHTSFASSSEDAIIWLAGLQKKEEDLQSDQASTHVAMAGTDTFHHEYFHVMMEMLRRSGAMPDDYVQEMGARFPARNARKELFNEEYAAEAYAKHVMKSPLVTKSEPWRFGS